MKIATIILAMLLAWSVTVPAQDVDTLKRDNERLTIQLRQANEEIARLRKLAVLPVDVTVRPSFSGDGKVFQFANQTDKVMTVKIVTHNEALQTTKEFLLALPAAYIKTTVKEIGHKEGWPVSPGDSVAVIAPGYPPLIKTVGND